ALLSKNFAHLCEGGAGPAKKASRLIKTSMASGRRRASWRPTLVVMRNWSPQMGGTQAEGRQAEARRADPFRARNSIRQRSLLRHRALVWTRTFRTPARRVPARQAARSFTARWPRKIPTQRCIPRGTRVCVVPDTQMRVDEREVRHQRVSLKLASTG